MNFKLILMAQDVVLYDAFTYHFRPFGDAVQVKMAYFEELDKYDCLVSPANSFGMMDGGMDQAIIDYFGNDLQNNVQKRILELYGGTQPIGTSFIIETGHPTFPFLAHTPTMFLPEDIQGTFYPYFAFKALLLAVIEHNKIHHIPIEVIACPGFGTGTGNIDPMIAAEQMATAYEFVCQLPTLHRPLFAYKKEQELLKNMKP